MIEPRIYRVRASSWGALFDCSYRWEGVNLLGIRSKSGLRAALGTAIHASTAAFDQGRVDGTNLSVMDTADVFVDTLHHPKDDTDLRDPNMTVAQAEAIGLTLHGRYCSTISPRFHYVAVEMSTTPMVIDCGGGIQIQLTGTMDRARAIADEWGVRIADVKTGARATERDGDTTGRRAKTKGHAPQVGTYEMLYEHTTGQAVTGPAEIIGMNTSKPEILVAEIHDARRMLLGDENNKGLIAYAAEMFRSGLFPPNPQSTMCSKQYCPRWDTCIYHN